MSDTRFPDFSRSVESFVSLDYCHFYSFVIVFSLDTVEPRFIEHFGTTVEPRFRQLFGQHTFVAKIGAVAQIEVFYFGV